MDCWQGLALLILSAILHSLNFKEALFLLSIYIYSSCWTTWAQALYPGIWSQYIWWGRPWGERRQKITWADFLDLGFPVSWWFLHWFSSCLDLKLIVIRSKKEIASLRELVRFSLQQRSRNMQAMEADHRTLAHEGCDQLK